MNARHAWLGGIAALGLAACAAPPAGPPPDSGERPYVGPSAEPGIPYVVDPDSSSIVVRVYRGGTLARLGHNHIVAAGPLDGRVIVREPVADSSASLGFAVDELRVDEPALRAAAGADFPGEVPADDIAGTHSNMLSESLLDAANFSRIELELPRLGDAPASGEAEVYVLIKGQPRALTMPLEITIERELIRARGNTTLTHGQLGLTPFSVMLGALAVRDDMDVAIDIVARRAPRAAALTAAD
ncbi:MAG: hypothetical protein AAFX58_08195 [Pseudomonadota bacterium]